MGVKLFVGKPGAGKTIELVRRTLADLELGRDIYANFMLGTRVDGYIVPTCPLFDLVSNAGIIKDAPCLGGHHKDHTPVTGHFVEWDPLIERLAREQGATIRHGRGFVPYPNVHLLTSWEQVLAIRVARDSFDTPHRLRLELRGVLETDDGPVQDWVAVPTCRVFDCPGCSKGITIAIDELNLWAPSREWQKLGVGVLNRWAYVRKDGLEVYATAQHESRVDVVMRQVTNEIWTCKVIGGVFPLFGRQVHLQLFTRQKWEPETLTEKGRTNATEGGSHSSPLGVLDYEYNRFSQKVAESYNTYEHVQSSQHLSDKQKGVTGLTKELIASHLRGNHDKKAARTCVVCQVKGGMVEAAPDVVQVSA